MTFSLKCVNTYTNKIIHRFYDIIFLDQSTVTRLFFGLVGISSGLFFITADLNTYGNEYLFMKLLAPFWLWGIGFIINGIALIYGAYTNKYSRAQLFLEGVLGVVVWIGSAYAVAIVQGTIGAHVMAGLIAFWIYIRYPTQWDGKNKR